MQIRDYQTKSKMQNTTPTKASSYYDELLAKATPKKVENSYYNELLSKAKGETVKTDTNDYYNELLNKYKATPEAIYSKRGTYEPVPRETQEKSIMGFKTTIPSDTKIDEYRTKWADEKAVTKEERNAADEKFKQYQDEMRSLTTKRDKTPEDIARVRELAKLSSESQIEASPGKFGVVEALSPTDFGKTEQKLYGTDEDIINKAKETGAYKTGYMGTKLATTAAQYSTINSILSGTKIGTVLAEKLGSKFAANQAVDLLADVIVQSPSEIAEAIRNDKSIGEDVKQMAINRAIDIGMNLVVGAKGGYDEFKANKVMQELERAKESLKAETKGAMKSTDLSDIGKKEIDLPSRGSKFTGEEVGYGKSEVSKPKEKTAVNDVRTATKEYMNIPLGERIKEANKNNKNLKNLGYSLQGTNIKRADIHKMKLSKDGDYIGYFDNVDKKIHFKDGSVQPIADALVKENLKQSNIFDMNIEEYKKYLWNKKPLLSERYFESKLFDDAYKDAIEKARGEGVLSENLKKQFPDLTKEAKPETPKMSDFKVVKEPSFGMPKAEKPIAMDIKKPKAVSKSVELPKVKKTVKKVEVPKVKKIKGTGKTVERGFSENIATDKAMAQEAQESFIVKPETYERLVNKGTLKKANDRFAKGYEKALKDFDMTKNELRPDNVVLSRLIANEAAKRGDLITMRRVLSEAAETLTSAGQYSQAARILRESNDPATVITYFEKELKKLNMQGKKRYGKKWNDISLNDDEIKILNEMNVNVTDVKKQEIFERVFNTVSERIPTTAREKLDAWRRIAMLTNPKTHIRNIVGNTIMTGVKKVSDAMATGAEKFIPKAKRTKAIFKDKSFVEAANKYWDNNKKTLTEGSRWEIFGVKSPFAEKKIFDNKKLQALNDFSMATLEGEDIVFLKHHFVNDLAGFMQARGLKEPTQKAIDYALRRAQEATFRQQNALADMIATGKKSRYGLLVEAAIPFSKTPANIVQTGLDYSPAGVVKSIMEIAQGAEPEVFIEEMSKGLTGTGLSVLGFYMARNGMARGEYKKSTKEEGLLTRAGEAPNSIKLKNGSYTIDWAQPAAIPFFMGVAYEEALAKATEKDDKDYVEALWNGVLAGGDTVVNQTMLRGIKDIMGSYGSPTQKIAELPINYLTQAFPTISGQIARSIDPVKRERDYSGTLPRVKTQTMAKMPIVSRKLPVKKDILGETQKYGEGALNTIQQFISPGYYVKAKNDSVTKELVRLYKSEGSDFIPRARVKSFTSNKVKYELTSKEISEFQTIMGTYTKNRIKELMKSKGYQNASDESKANMIKKTNAIGYEKAKKSIIEGR